MQCWKCGKELEGSVRVGFRAECPHCYSWLHCCRNCRHYQPERPNDCAIPGTEPIADRTAFNFCEEFSLLGKPPQKQADRDAIEKKLFG